MKSVDVKSSTYIASSKEINNKDTKFKTGDFVRKSKYKNIFAKVYIQISLKMFFVIKKIKNTVPWTYVINDLNGEKLAGTFYEKELQKTNEKKFRIERVTKKKGEKLYVKWIGYNNSFHTWIDKKDIV